MNKYIKIDNTPANIAAINLLNAAGLISKDATDYVTSYVQMFWNYATAIKTTVYDVGHLKLEFAETNPSDVFIMIEVTPSNYALNQIVIDNLEGCVIYNSPEDFIAAYPNRLNLTITINSFFNIES